MYNLHLGLVKYLEHGGHPYMRRQATRREILTEECCFFYDKVGTEAAPLHDAMTPKITQRVRICALKLQDQKLIAKYVLVISWLKKQSTIHSAL